MTEQLTIEKIDELVAEQRARHFRALTGHYSWSDAKAIMADADQEANRLLTIRMNMVGA